MTLRPDEGYGDLLQMLADHPSPVHQDDADRIRAAILADGRAHAGEVDPNRVRDALTNRSGELDVWHKAVGPQYAKLRALKLIEQRPNPILSTDRRGRNAGKWIHAYRLTAAGWHA